MNINISLVIVLYCSGLIIEYIYLYSAQSHVVRAVNIERPYADLQPITAARSLNDQSQHGHVKQGSRVSKIKVK